MNRRVFITFAIIALPFSSALASELSISGTRFQLDGKPFSYVAKPQW